MRHVHADIEIDAPFIGVWLPFVITEVESLEFWHWQVAGVPATRHSIVPVGASQSRAEFTVPVPLAPYVVVLRMGLGRLKQLAETWRTAATAP